MASGPRLLSALSLALVFTIAVACDVGSRSQPRAPGEPAPQIVVAIESNEEPLASCGGVVFPAAALEGPAGADAQPGPDLDAVRDALNEFRGDLPLPRDAEWRFAVENAGRLTFLTEVDGDWFYATVVADGDGWRPVNMGDCQLHTVASQDLGAATWWLDERLPPPAADSTELAVLVEERACASGSFATGRIGSPSVKYFPDVVVITVGVRGIGGTCPSNPSTPAVIVLTAPIGDRQLLDGYHIPPAPPSAPEGFRRP